MSENTKVTAFKAWLTQNGGGFHPQASYIQAASGLGLIACQDIPPDEEIVSCPIELVVSPSLARDAVSRLLGLQDCSLSSRQWISLYLSLHQLVESNDDPEKCLKHRPYGDILPSPGDLSTPLYFTTEELERFKGTNLYGATQDRIRDWQEEWQECRQLVSQSNPAWGAKFEWKIYLASATYIGSRAFPSSLLSSDPTLPRLDSDNDETIDPILLPGIDCLNHARGQPVSWISHSTTKDNGISKISLVVHRSVSAGQEIFNNYGPKPNSELVLSYGFSLANNPDDSIILKLGGVSGKKWQIGRLAQGADGLWKEILEAMTDDESTNDYEAILDASGALQDMVKTSIRRLPAMDKNPTGQSLRPHVATMLQDYVEGQAATFQSLLDFAEKKEQEGIALAKEAGFELVIEDED